MSDNTHFWKKNDAAKIDDKVYRVLSVTRQNLPTVRIKNDQVIAKSPSEWEYVGEYRWSFNPFTPGDPFWRFHPISK